MICALHGCHNSIRFWTQTFHRLSSNANSPSSRAKVRWDLLLKRGRREARAIINNKPIGRFSKDEFRNASQLLQLFKSSRASDATTAHTAISLLERLAFEIASDKVGIDPDAKKRLCNPILIIRILAIYKNAAKAGEKVIPPVELLLRLINVHQMLPCFMLDYVTIRIIVSVATLSTPASDAPKIVEGLLSQILRMNTDHRLNPNFLRHLWNEILQAWATSGMPEAQERMKELTERMLNNGISLDTLSYNILLRYYTGKMLVKDVESTLQTMRIQKMKPTTENILRSILVFVAVGRSDDAEKLLEQAVHVMSFKSDPTTIRMIIDCTKTIIQSHRRVVATENQKFQKLRADDRIDHLFQTVNRMHFLGIEKKNRLLNAVMDLEARFGDFQKALAMFHVIEPKSTLSYNILLNGLARSDQADALDHALALWKSMDLNSESHLRADLFSFSALLKCLSKSKSSDAGRQAIDLLDEMERRNRAGDPLKPNEIPYVLAIQTCLYVNDIANAEKVMERLKRLKYIYPSLQHFSSFLMSLNNIRSADAAHFGESLIHFMRDKSLSGNPILRPNLLCYLLLLSVFKRSKDELGSTVAAEGMIRTFEMAKHDGFGLDAKLCSAIIYSMSKTNDRRFLGKADEILKDLEENFSSQLEHGLFDCLSLGWLQADNLEKALDVVMRGVRKYVEGRIRQAPDEKIFENIFTEFLSREDLEKATKVQLEVLQLTNSSWPTLEPTVRALQNLRSAWENSSSRDRLRQVALLNEHILNVESKWSQKNEIVTESNLE